MPLPDHPCRASQHINCLDAETKEGRTGIRPYRPMLITTAYIYATLSYSLTRSFYFK
ncbi:unknown [Prevotella sp. CAG:924]|nr:unknown [Prevotella sp. CAG:924]